LGGTGDNPVLSRRGRVEIEQLRQKRQQQAEIRQELGHGTLKNVELIYSIQESHRETSSKKTTKSWSVQLDTSN
jgi:hypothetical protein